MWGKAAVAFARVELPKVISAKPDDPKGAFRELEKRWKAHLELHAERLGLKKAKGSRSSSGGGE